MAQFTWTYDAPSGTYKSRAISDRLYKQAVEDTVFMDHVTPISSFGKRQGETVSLYRVLALTEPTTATLTEGIRIPEDTLTMSSTTVTVKELGRAVPYTNLAEDLGKWDVENVIQAELRRQMALVLDTEAAAAFTGTDAYLKYIPTGLASYTMDTDGTASTAATENMNTYHLEQIRDLAYDTYLIPTFPGGTYTGIFRSLSFRGIKNDPAWSDWHKYTDPTAKFNNEIGKWENIRLIETNHNEALGKIGTSSVLGEGVVFGPDAVAMVEAQTPELRAAVPADFGRSKAVAWYGILNFGVIYPSASAGLAKIIHVASS